MKQDSEGMTTLRGCGWAAQLPGILFMIAGVSGVVGRLGTGDWPPILEHEVSPVLSGTFCILVSLVGLAMIMQGQRVKTGSRSAAAWLVVIGSVALAGALTHLLVAGHGWYEALLCALLTVDSLVAFFLARDVPRAAP